MNTAGHQLIYDDSCGFCQRSIGLLRKLDWFNTIEPIPMSAADDLMARHFISLDAMMAAGLGARSTMDMWCTDAPCYNRTGNEFRLGRNGCPRPLPCHGHRNTRF